MILLLVDITTALSYVTWTTIIICMKIRTEIIWMEIIIAKKTHKEGVIYHLSSVFEIRWHVINIWNCKRWVVVVQGVVAVMLWFGLSFILSLIYCVKKVHVWDGTVSCINDMCDCIPGTIKWNYLRMHVYPVRTQV